MALPNAPQSRNERYLAKIAGQEIELPNEPLSREEQYLDYIAKNGSGGGGYVLPAATASRLGGVKIGSGINVEEDGTISAEGGSSLEAGNYIKIENNVISVTKEISDFNKYKYELTAKMNGTKPYLEVKKYINDTLASTTSIPNDGQVRNVDDVMTIRYTYGVYTWDLTLLEDSVEHDAGYTESWNYQDSTPRIFNFEVPTDPSTTLVTKADLTADNVMMSDGVTSVEDRLDSLRVESGSFDFNASLFDTYNKTVYYKKQANVVMLVFNIKTSTAISADVIIGSIPSALRPSSRLWITGSVGLFYLEPNGDFKTLMAVTAEKWIYLTLTYII